jgi:hypothetical protein
MKRAAGTPLPDLFKGTCSLSSQALARRPFSLEAGSITAAWQISYSMDDVRWEPRDP